VPTSVTAKVNSHGKIKLTHGKIKLTQNKVNSRQNRINSRQNKVNSWQNKINEIELRGLKQNDPNGRHRARLSRFACELFLQQIINY
jgi:peptidoglycan hydrolase CwlO-like protein